jgi:SAM-dependent methyltransferase
VPGETKVEWQSAFHEHLARCGLRRFTSDEAYFSWQRESLSPGEIEELHRRVEAKRSGNAADEVAFYDLTAQPRILSVLYSQRYDYYCALGPLVAARLGEPRRVLDFGCGVGILTSFYAQQFPHISFLGVDRSPVSIAAAESFAAALGLTNLRFANVDMMAQPLCETFDLIIATHALVQAEQDSGLPSRTWSTFARDCDPASQRAFEIRTGVGRRLDCLGGSLASRGRMMLFEKVRQLARRVPFQRALARRGLALLEEPTPVRYNSVEEVVDDGPLFQVQDGAAGLPWDEAPESDEAALITRVTLPTPSADSAGPLYENHGPSAQGVWEQLRDRVVVKEMTKREQDGRQLHAELGTAEGIPYLYCANTFDQRQLVLVRPDQSAVLDAYYREIEEGEGDRSRGAHERHRVQESPTMGS